MLDEVTSALDKKTSNNILKSINQLSKNKTCIYISHDDYEINKNSQKLIISNTKIPYKYKSNITQSASLSNTLLGIIFIHHFFKF